MKNCLIVDVASFYGGGQRFIADFAFTTKGKLDLHVFAANEKLKDELNGWPVTMIAASYSKAATTIAAINSYVARHHISTVILNGNRAIYMAPFIRCRNKIAYKHTTNLAVAAGIRRAIAAISLQTCYFFTDKIVLLFRDAVKELIFSKSKVVIIPNGVNTQLWKREEAADSDGPVVILQAARLDRFKGQMETIRALMEVYRTHPNFEYWIVGTGDEAYLEQIRTVIRENNLSFVKLLGFRNDIRELLSKSAISVLASHFEAFPLGLLEAMAMENAIVATQVGGIPGMVTHGENGYLVAPKDEQALALYLGKLVADAALRKEFGRKSRQLAVEKFDINTTVQALVEII